MDRINLLGQHLQPSVSETKEENREGERLTLEPCQAQRVVRNYGKGRLPGKVALITGAGSGIGRAAAILFAEQGAQVMCLDWNADGAKQTATEIEKLVGPGKAIARPCDVSKESDVIAAVDECCKAFTGSIDICFANAGVTGLPSVFTEIDTENIDAVFKVNVYGVLYCFKHAVKRMIDQDRPGSLIATASVAGIRSGAGDTIYSASKAAVVSICQTVANQLTGTGIRCNAICPGIIETGMTKIVFDAADNRGIRDRIGHLNPMLRYGVPEEIASVALFLASDDSSYVTGQAIPVCGGLTSSHPVSRRKKLHVSV